MTSDSQAPSTHQSSAMPLLHAHASAGPHQYLSTTNPTQADHTTRGPMPLLSTKKKAPNEHSRLLDTSSQLTGRSSPTSNSSTSPSEQERVYPWTYNTSVSTPMPIGPSSGEKTNGGSRDSPAKPQPDQQPVTTLSKWWFAKAQSLSSSLPSASSTAANFNIVGSGGSGHGQQRRRHSILRVSSNRSMSERSLRKSASVEFALHHEATQKLTQADQRETTSNTTPRRLTFEEREELYKVRPDLEVGPTPFFKEQMREMEQRNQRRMLFAILGGMLCIMFLMVIYYILSIAQNN